MNLFGKHLRRVNLACMQVLEKARTGKLLGAALEARVVLHVADSALRARLAALDSSSNGADPLRYAFIVSQVRICCCFCLASVIR